ncbi:hypothetical protein Tco_0347520 [Tanacetum coccineum]
MITYNLSFPDDARGPKREAALHAPRLSNYVPGPEEPEQAPPSPDYVPGPQSYIPESDPEEDDDEDLEEDPADYLADGGDDGDDEDEPSDDDEDEEVDIEADDEEEEEYPAAADSIAVTLPAIDQAPSAEETEPFETDESTATPPPHPAYRVTARISIPAPVPTPVWSDAEVARLLAISTPPSSPLSPWSSPLPQIPFPPLPSIPSLSLPLSLPLRVSALPPASPISPTSSPPLLLPSNRREDKLEVTLPPRKRLGIALGPRYEVEESSSAAAARPTRGLRADYSFVATMDREIMRDLERDVGYGITDSWDEIVEAIDWRAHARTARLMETEARMSREAWGRSIDASDLARAEVISLRTQVVAQQAVITELQAADRRRQAVIIEMLAADHKRQKQFIEALKLLKRLQTQMTEFERQQGPAKGPAQPDAPQEAGSSS